MLLNVREIKVGNVLAGVVVDKVFFIKRYKEVGGEWKHFFGKFNGYGISVKALDEALDFGAELILCEEIDGLNTNYYTIPATTFAINSKPWEDESPQKKALNDKQLVCDINLMKKIER
jgi:hypothetical protein